MRPRSAWSPSAAAAPPIQYAGTRISLPTRSASAAVAVAAAAAAAAVEGEAAPPVAVSPSGDATPFIPSIASPTAPCSSSISCCTCRCQAAARSPATVQNRSSPPTRQRFCGLRAAAASHSGPSSPSSPVSLLPSPALSPAPSPGPTQPSSPDSSLAAGDDDGAGLAPPPRAVSRRFACCSSRGGRRGEAGGPYDVAAAPRALQQQVIGVVGRPGGEIDHLGGLYPGVGGQPGFDVCQREEEAVLPVLRYTCV